jgi:hypothetical protein
LSERFEDELLRLSRLLDEELERDLLPLLFDEDESFFVYWLLCIIVSFQRLVGV